MRWPVKSPQIAIQESYCEVAVSLKSQRPQVSETLASHPGLNVALGLCLRDARAVLDHGAELNLVLDRRQVEVGHKAPLLLGVLHVALLARDRVGALAALESEHDGSPWRASGRRPGRTVVKFSLREEPF
jgi:hypothetical protein